MGSVWVHNLPQIVADAGLPWRTWQGWETRSRSSGGYDDILAVGIHHTASSASPDNDCSYIWNNSGDRPIGAVLLDRDGRVTIGAAGATNTQGKGGPVHCSNGTIPLDAGNKFMFSIEAANNGVGERWPSIQQDNYAILCAALCDAFGLDPERDCLSHFEWTSRKIDPAGDSRYANGSASWDMDAFRRDVIEVSPNPPLPGPGPDPGPTPTPEDDVSNVLILEDVRNGAWYRCGAEAKSWIRDGNMSAQVIARLDETRENGVAVDGFRYIKMTNGNVDFIRSTGPIVGPTPAGVDEYGG